MKKETIISLVITLVVGLVTFYIFLPPINLHSLGFLTYLLFLLIVFTICNSLGSIISRRKFKDIMFAPKYLVIGCIIIFAYIFIGNVVCSPIFMSKSYSERITINQDNDFVTDVKEVDFNKLPLLFSIPMAMAGMLSVNKFMNNRCTAANGIGRLIIAQ